MDVYLDNAGCTRFHTSLLKRYFNLLDTVVFGNPHSEGSPSSASTQNSVDRVRRRILRHFNASPQDYCVVFTQNASNAVKIIADGLPWATGWPDNLNSQRQEVRAPTTSHLHQLIKSLIIRVTKCLFSPFIRLFRPRKSTKLILLQDNHTSIIGLRAVAQHHCASVSTLDPISFDRETKQNTEFDCRLFAFPAQSNFNGYQYPLHWLNNIKQHPRSLSLLDACSFVGTSRLDLQCYPADFVAISFYKVCIIV
jgi:molybdenum cofactor sulfurtransferase